MKVKLDRKSPAKAQSRPQVSGKKSGRAHKSEEAIDRILGESISAPSLQSSEGSKKSRKGKQQGDGVKSSKEDQAFTALVSSYKEKLFRGVHVDSEGLKEPRAGSAKPSSRWFE